MGTTPREVCSQKKTLFRLSADQKSVLVGTLLGDGTMQRRGRHYRLHVKHSRNQLDLARFKRIIFEPIVEMKIRLFDQEVKGKKYEFVEFVTLTHAIFTDYYHLFYPQGKKQVPQTIFSYLTQPLSLAVWLMDDGSAEYAGVSLQTHSFSWSEVKLLQEVLKMNFSLETTMKKNKGKYIIYFPKSVLKRLRLLVEPLVLPSFRYKLQPYSMRT